MRGDDLPALGEAYPGLHLTADLAGRRGAMSQSRDHRKIAAKSRDDSLRESARPRATGASPKRRNFRVAVEVFGIAVADCSRIVAKARVENGNVVCHHRFFVGV